MKPVVCFLLTLLLTLPALAQRPGAKPTIGGMVVDSATGKPMPLATVALLNLRDSSYVMGTTTDGDGLFRFRNVALGRYRLLLTFVGYRNSSREVTVSAGEPMAEVGVVRMVEQSNELQEVVVRQERPPVTVRQDTLEFNAGSFKTQPNASVEELLRKLPGMQVSRDGTIKAQGQTVYRVLVDGKPFFGDDHRMATRNLPAGIVDKVQLFDQSSDQSQFSGIDDGNRQRTINLTLRRDKRKGYFGQNSLGMGTARDGQANRYQGQLNLNRFNNGRQLSLVGQANNLNQQNFTLGGGVAQAPVFVGNPDEGESGPPPPTTNVIEVRAGGLNYRGKLGRRAEVATSYFLNQGITTTDQQSRRTNILPAVGRYRNSLRTDQAYYSQNRQLTHRAHLRLDWQLDSMTSLRLTPSLSWQTTDFASQLSSRSALPASEGQLERLVNTGKTTYGSAGHSLNAYNNLLIMRKFRREGRSLSVNLNTVLGDGDARALNQSVNTFYDSTGTNPLSSVLNQQLRQTTYNQQNTLTVSYTEPLSFTQKLELRYAYSVNGRRADRLVSDQDEATKQYDRLNAPLSNQFANTFAFHQTGATFQTQRLRYRIAIGADVQQSQLQMDNRSAGTSQQRQYVSLLPNALFAYTFSGNQNLRLAYRTRLNAPTIGQLQPVIDNTNPLNVRVGNPQLNPEYINTLVLTHNGASGEGDKSFFLFASLNQSNNRIATSTTVSPSGVQTTQPVNAGGFWSANGAVSIGRTLHPSPLGLTLSTNVGFNGAISFINQEPNKAENVVVGQGVRLQSNFNSTLEWGLSGNVTYQRATYSLLPNQNAAFWSQYATADVFWKLPFRFVLTSDLTYTATSGRAAGYNQRFVLWNVALARQFFKGDQGELRLQLFDLLNQNRSLLRNTTDTYIEDVQSRILRRYLLISFAYNLRKFGL